MRKILVLQHVAHEILGTLNPLLKAEGFRIRYVNFHRNPDTKISLDNYSGLIVLGGPMGVYDCGKFQHLTHEMEVIEDALKRDIPLLGICLGSQLLAEVLGGKVRKSKTSEIGWYDVSVTEDGHKDVLLKNFRKTEKIFQWHGDTFDIPKGAKHLAQSDACEAQAFSVGKAYGLQFHVEVDEAMIHRWLKIPANMRDMTEGQFSESLILSDTKKYMENSLDLSRRTFSAFIDLFGKKEKWVVLGSGHGKTRKK